MPRRIPKKPAVAVSVVGLPHCDVTPPKETTARRMPMPMVISAGFQNAFPGARTGSKSDSSGGVAITEMGSIAEVVLMTKKS
jgi:hypothetical protein